MDILTLLGVILGFAAILGGNFLEGGALSSLLNLPAAIIVIGGTLAAAMLQTQPAKMQQAFARLKWVLNPPLLPFKKTIDKIINCSMTARKEGFLGLEKLASKEKDSFFKKGLQLLIDGGDTETIRNVLSLESELMHQNDQEAAHFFESMGGYAPTIGILGAVMGLINVMSNLAEPSKLGNGIAIAFVATIYGVAFANLLLLPVAGKLRNIAAEQAVFRELIIEGISGIADGHNPRSIQLKLSGFLHSR